MYLKPHRLQSSFPYKCNVAHSVSQCTSMSHHQLQQIFSSVVRVCNVHTPAVQYVNHMVTIDITIIKE